MWAFGEIGNSIGFWVSEGREGLRTCVCGIECALARARARESAEDGDGGGSNFGVGCSRVGVGGELILAIAIAGFWWCFVWGGRGRERWTAMLSTGSFLHAVSTFVSSLLLHCALSLP